MSAYSDAVLALSPVAYWQLAEPNPTTGSAIDSTPNGHDLPFVSGDNASITPGPTGCGMVPAIDVGAAGVAADQSSLWDLWMPMGDDARSLIAWFKVTGTTFGYLFSYGRNVANQNFLLGVNYPGFPGELYFNNRDNDQPKWGAGLNDDEWHMAAVTYANAATSMDGYVDGVHEGSEVLVDGALNTQEFGLDLLIGGSNEGGSIFPGAIGQVAVFDYVLSSAEIADLWDKRCVGGWQVGSVAL